MDDNITYLILEWEARMMGRTLVDLANLLPVSQLVKDAKVYEYVIADGKIIEVIKIDGN